jgi:nucleotide-binding universal stress UspA family protein
MCGAGGAPSLGGSTTKKETTMILASYDGSADAQSAIDRAALLMPGAEATVLTVWEPFQLAPSGGGMGMGMIAPYPDNGAIDAANQAAAQAQATEGADRATAAGLDAEPRIAVCVDSVAATILAVSDELDAEAIVVGTRGLTGLRSMLLGSVSHHLLQHADRSVIVVPSPAVADERRGWIHRREIVAVEV